MALNHFNEPYQRHQIKAELLLLMYAVLHRALIAVLQLLQVTLSFQHVTLTMTTLVTGTVTMIVTDQNPRLTIMQMIGIKYMMN